MTLQARFASRFRPLIRERGLEYFRAGAVKILEHSDFHVTAQVEGTFDYFVELSHNSRSFDVGCTCPYFADGEDCKHLWATILAADSTKLFSGLDLRHALPLVHDEDTLEGLQLLEDEAPPALPPPLPHWQRQLASITNAIKYVATPERLAWPTGREIFYVINPDTSRSSGLLNVEINFRELTKKGQWGKLKKTRIKQPNSPNSAIQMIEIYFLSCREAKTLSGPATRTLVSTFPTPLSSQTRSSP